MPLPWTFVAGLSLGVFAAVLVVAPVLTPAPQTLAARINHQTLKAAAAIKAVRR
jgi:hypothetical protein